MSDAYRTFTFRGNTHLVSFKDFKEFYPKTSFDDFARMTEGDIGALMRRVVLR